MRGSNMKAKNLRRPSRLQHDIIQGPDEKESPNPHMGRPYGSLGLRKGLEKQYGPNLSASQKELINFYCNLNEKKTGDLKDRDMFNIISMQRSILKQLDGTIAPSFRSARTDPYDDMTLEELEAGEKQAEQAMASELEKMIPTNRSQYLSRLEKEEDVDEEGLGSEREICNLLGKLTLSETMHRTFPLKGARLNRG